MLLKLCTCIFRRSTSLIQSLTCWKLKIEENLIFSKKTESTSEHIQSMMYVREIIHKFTAQQQKQAFTMSNEGLTFLCVKIVHIKDKTKKVHFLTNQAIVK